MGIGMKIQVNRSIDFYFLFFSIISMVSLAFFRLQILGFFIPIHFMIFFCYIYFKWPFLSIKRSFKIKDFFLVFLLLSLIFWGVISLIFATEHNFRNFFQITVFVLYTIIVTQSIKDFDIDSINTLVKLLRIVLTFLAFWALYGYFSGNSIVAQYTHLFKGDFGSRNVDTYVILPGYLISLSYLFFRRSIFFSFFSISIIFLAVLLSFSRGSLMILLALSIMSLLH